MKSLVFCPTCHFGVFIENGTIKRASQSGSPIYCGRECAGLARRKAPIAPAARKALKSAYDTKYRERNRERIKARKAARYQATCDREAERAYRQQFMSRHVEYCRRPEYRAWKRDYDRAYRAKYDFGEFWESALLLSDIDAEIGSRITRTEIYAQNGTQNKSLQRKRDYAKTLSR